MYLRLLICIWIESSWLQSSLKCAVLIMRALRQFRLNSYEPRIFSFWDMQCYQGSILSQCLRHAIPYPNDSLRFSLSLKVKSSKIFDFFYHICSQNKWFTINQRPKPFEDFDIYSVRVTMKRQKKFSQPKQFHWDEHSKKEFHWVRQFWQLGQNFWLKRLLQNDRCAKSSAL